MLRFNKNSEKKKQQHSELSIQVLILYYFKQVATKIDNIYMNNRGSFSQKATLEYSKI